MNTIPKVIHYLWFGEGKKSHIIEKCINSWKEKLPEYEIIEWNEKNFNVKCNNYVKQAYEARKYAFVSDYARLYILYKYGGIYMDTDVEVLKSLDYFLENEGFMAFENKKSINPGLIFGCIKGNNIIKEIIEEYDTMNFINQDNTFNTKTICNITTEILVKHGLKLNNSIQNVENIKIYSSEYFAPTKKQCKIDKLPEVTCTIHHYEGSWLSDKQKKLSRIWIYRICAIFASELARVIEKIIGIEKWKRIRKSLFSWID